MGAEINPFYSPGKLELGHPGLPLAPPNPIETKRLLAPVRQRRDAQPLDRDSATPGVKAVLFDVEDVLYDASAWGRWLAQVLARETSKSAEKVFDQLWEEDFLPQVYRGERDFHAALVGCLASVGLAAAQVEEIVAASRAQRRQQENSLRAFPGVRATLDQLRTAGIQRAILTNADRTSGALRDDLTKIGLDRAFDLVLTSLDLGACLPEAACYEPALQRLQMTAPQVLFVSHDPRALAGAVAAGLAAVAFNARQQVPVPQIDRFEQLCDVITAAVAGHFHANVACQAADHCAV